jgi:hypothetical protein
MTPQVRGAGRANGLRGIGLGNLVDHVDHAFDLREVVGEDAVHVL